MTLRVVPVFLTDARRFVAAHHSHHDAPQGGLFAVAGAELRPRRERLPLWDTVR